MENWRSYDLDGWDKGRCHTRDDIVTALRKRRMVMWRSRWGTVISIVPHGHSWILHEYGKKTEYDNVEAAVSAGIKAVAEWQMPDTPGQPQGATMGGEANDGPE